MTSRLPGAAGPARPAAFLFRGVLLLLLCAIPVSFWLSTPSGRRLLLETRLGWASLVHPGRPDAAGDLFRGELSRALHAAGIDTALLRVEPPARRGGGLYRTRWEIPLPEGFAPSRGNAIVTRAVERFGGRIEDGVEEAPNRILLTASLGHGLGADFLVMGKEAARGTARLALLVDLFGYRNMAESQALLEMGRGLSAAILPHTTGARDLADQCRAHGLEVLLDLPMEGLDYPRVDPGPGAILVDMAPGEIARRVGRAIDQIGGASGVHTFLGELAVEDPDVMKAVLSSVAERHAYFVESTSSSFSVVRETAARVGVASLRLKDEIDAPGVAAGRVRQNLARLAGEARESGIAVGLIHPYPATVTALKELLPEWSRQGIELVPLSEIVTVPSE